MKFKILNLFVCFSAIFSLICCNSPKPGDEDSSSPPHAIIPQYNDSGELKLVESYVSPTSSYILDFQSPDSGIILYLSYIHNGQTYKHGPAVRLIYSDSIAGYTTKLIFIEDSTSNLAYTDSLKNKCLKACIKYSKGNNYHLNYKKNKNGFLSAIEVDHEKSGITYYVRDSPYPCNGLVRKSSVDGNIFTFQNWNGRGAFCSNFDDDNTFRTYLLYYNDNNVLKHITCVESSLQKHHIEIAADTLQITFSTRHEGAYWEYGKTTIVRNENTGKYEVVKPETY